MDTPPENSIFGRSRRRSVRHKVHSPAYASFSGSSQATALEFCEILNVSESGMCIQASGPMKVNRLLPLVLDLSETGARIHSTGHVVWSDASGKTGIRFPEIPEASRLQLYQWLARNDVAAAARSAVAVGMECDSVLASQPIQAKPASVAAYSSLIAEWADIERNVGLFGPDLEPALQLIAERALTLTWATGAAIALMNRLKPFELICRARAGSDSPELGARLQAGSGFSGECVRAATMLKCDDTETDLRVDRKSCRALQIRSLIACPIKARKGEVIGILEVFSPEAAAFWDNDATILARLARITADAVSRAEHTRPDVLAVSCPEYEQEPNLFLDTIHSVQEEVVTLRKPSLGRKAVLLLTGIAAVTLTVWLVAPWIVDSSERFVAHSNPQIAEAMSASDKYAALDISNLKEIASRGDAAAQYSLGMRYASGESVGQDYRQAVGWFLKSANNGDVRAAAKMAACFWAGKGAPRDYSKAYFWGLVAKAGGDQTGQVIVINSAQHLSDHQRFAEQQQADAWLRLHHFSPPAEPE